LHRLNRAEYGNAIRDLLDLEIDAAALLPADEALDGFDNIGGALSVSPALLERYLSAARRISRLTVGDPTIGPAFASATYDAPQTLFQDGRMSDAMPFGSRGGLAVRHRFPLDGEYEIRVGLLRNIAGYVRGLARQRQLEVRIDGRRIGLLTVGGGNHGDPAPRGFTGVIAGDPDWEAYVPTADTGLALRTRVSAGTRTVTVSFINEPVEQEGVLQPPLTGLGYSYSEYTSAPTGPGWPAVSVLTVNGPDATSGAGDTASRRRLFVCRPATAADEASCARTILAGLARRAYRRPSTDADVARLLEFFERGRRAGGFESGIQAALERMLVDPSFLFRVERDPTGAAPGSAYRVTDLELASRLSFFLWSSIPDDTLLALAEAGRLHEPGVLAIQTQRMLADPRASALVDGFGAQWLGLRRLGAASPDPEMFSAFDESLRAAFAQETRLFVESQFREDHPITGLLTADYTFLNERLARHYNLPPVYGNHFRRMTLHGNDRLGLLGHGSILTLTSYPTRTSPVLRGRWLLDTLFGAPPPPPPPNVPPLPPSVENNRLFSMRERTELHRRNPVCASCHVRMDPLGFALEHFDPIGQWRTTDAGVPIDASGELPDGTTFIGVSGLRALVAGQRENLARTVTKKLLTYALGRRVEMYDMPAVRTIVHNALATDLRWSTLITGIVRSVPFQMRRTES
jgi:hypothetical protein